MKATSQCSNLFAFLIAWFKVTKVWIIQETVGSAHRPVLSFPRMINTNSTFL